MESEQINFNRLQKENSSRTQSTDTDPEVENENKTKKKEKHILNDNEEGTKTERKIKSGFKHLISKLPSYDYNVPKKRKKEENKNRKSKNNELYPINERETDNNRFVSFEDAFLCVAQHCEKYHRKYTREICRQYLDECYILDFAQDGFIPIMSKLSPKDFNRYFQLSQRDHKYI